MGHQHYFNIKWECPKCLADWPQLVEDARLIIEAADVDLTGNCNEREEAIPPIVNLDQICFNGIAENGHEPFIFGPNAIRDRGWVKTNLKPYNLVITNFLLRAHHLLRGESDFSSDGGWYDRDWVATRDLYKVLWPGELVFCPWAADPDGILKADNATPAVIEARVSVEEKLRQLQLDAASLSQLTGPVKSTVDRVDFTHPRQWLDEVIDVRKRCIVEAPGNCSFVILTYVWGGIDQPRLIEETRPRLSKEGGLTAIWAKVPTTVRDAIEVCEKLGERYLWFDALCIQQDASRDMRVQIMRMKRIYSSAKCTIVAASAATADVGLLGAPGDGNGSVADCTSEDELDALLETTPWNSRACANEAPTVLRPARDSHHVGGKADDRSDTSIPPGDDFESYLSAVEYYSARQLTSQADKLSAFQAIFQRYRGSIDGRSSGFLYGMPVDGFDQMICWQSQLHNPNQRNKAFPSWSWLGWNDPVIFNRKLLAAGRTRQILQCENAHWMITSGGSVRDKKIRRRADLNRPQGFPSSKAPYFHHVDLMFMASTLYLSIDGRPIQTKSTNGLYAVRPALCSYLVSTLEKQPEDGEESIHLGLDIHDTHPPECDAKSVLGHIWLDRDWRQRPPNEPEYCVFIFIVMAGEKRETRGDCQDADQDEDGGPNMDEWSEEERHQYRYMKSRNEPDNSKWNITVLMCVEEMGDRNYERVQVMDCCVPEEEWERLGGRTDLHSLI